MISRRFLRLFPLLLTTNLRGSWWNYKLQRFLLLFVLCKQLIRPSGATKGPDENWPTAGNQEQEPTRLPLAPSGHQKHLLVFCRTRPISPRKTSFSKQFISLIAGVTSLTTNCSLALRFSHTHKTREHPPTREKVLMTSFGRCSWCFFVVLIVAAQNRVQKIWFDFPTRNASHIMGTILLPNTSARAPAQRWSKVEQQGAAARILSHANFSVLLLILHQLHCERQKSNKKREKQGEANKTTSWSNVPGIHRERHNTVHPPRDKWHFTTGVFAVINAPRSKNRLLGRNLVRSLPQNVSHRSSLWIVRCHHHQLLSSPHGLVVRVSNCRKICHATNDTLPLKHIAVNGAFLSKCCSRTICHRSALWATEWWGRSYTFKVIHNKFRAHFY